MRITSEAVHERDRSKIPERYTWDLSDIYRDDGEWREHKAKLVAEFPMLERYRGKLFSSPAVLLECLESVNRIGKEFTRLYCYASMKSHEDTRVGTYLAMEQEMSQLGADFAVRVAFIEPEILSHEQGEIDACIAREPGLEVYRHSLDDTMRRKEHTLSEAEENILANAALISDSPGMVYEIFSDADFPFPTVTLSDGKTVKLDKANFSLYRVVPDREDRKKVFAAYFDSLHQYRRTFGAQLAAEVRKNMFFSKSRRYASSLHRALDASNIPVEVYHKLIENVNAHLGTFHRYLKLRQRMLGLDTLHYHDLYVPMVADIDLKYSIEEAIEATLDSLAPLGDSYVKIARQGLHSRWLDVFPNDGKRSGAYSNGGVYDVHPYMLLNYNGKFDDVSTLTHELGHTMHSYLTNKTQEYVNSHYSIFVAEVASTFNEALLVHHMLNVISDDGIRLSILGNYLDGVRGTIFRQTQFCEFEWRIHELAERGEALTGDSLDALYREICRRYYGHDEGACVVDEQMDSEWANIPHFYYNFYVFQYATSFTASVALSEQVLSGDADALKGYVKLLSAGGSDYPIELLKRAGVDMTSSGPFEMAMRKANATMDLMERMLGGSGG